jgi:cystathionine beta-synthase
MLEKAEKEGKIKEGGTIIEPTSGNTGIGLALYAISKGYKCIFTIQDKQSIEKINLLKAVGAEVIVCPTDVARDDPRSYYSVAKKLASEIPNSFCPDQYTNMGNPQSHYETTGPEIYKDTNGKITHFFACVGTGGTISGVGKFLKEKNKNIKVIGVDPIGSILYDYFKTGKITQPRVYKVEGIGEDFIPKTLDFSVIDDMVQISDKEAFEFTRKLVRLEGVLAGGSSGAVLAGFIKYKDKLKKGDLAVLLFPDSALRYVGKIFNDQWLKENNFL